MARLTLKGVRKVYEGGAVAVHGVDLDVADGELVVLVGPSGCGKSTTLRMIAGLESISAGKLLIDDQEVNDLPPARRDIAMVFQSYALYPHMTVRDNMRFALRVRKMAATEAEQRIAETAQMLDIVPLLDRLPKQLSGGQRQRVAIGRAIVRQPKVFLFDEPLSNLDAKLRVATRREISRLQRRLGVTSIYVTHDQTEAMTMGDRIVVMNAGKVQQIDTPIALYERPKNLFVATFIGSPPMNVMRGTLERVGDGLEFRGAGIALPLDGERSRALAAHAGKPVVAGVRPEHVHAAAPPSSARAVSGFTVDVVEPLGNETLLHARGNGQDLTASLSPQSLPEPGQPVPLA
ncbi:MAG TPA: sn-glycerol-3-phosphate ABC transporter ATP-binding protein UgpC, partial [Gemmatimonadaceae bacterium]|nr:sn-glycerol-3-phosphate ABC transporter ATP-binding protein UgpC [Gemmatimonadaceae bacterium]